ncbi:MAG: glycosyltransferase [Methanomicrobiales archaeon]|nr:glycosyltransferase [Methanomicrobiales archaeon]
MAKDTKTKAAPAPTEEIAPGPEPGNIAVQEHDAKSIPTGLFVVIPTRNNELVIGSLVHLCRQYAESVIVVDEDSDDRTWEIATDAGAHLVRINPDDGKNRAMFTGFQVAPERGCSAVVLYDSEGIFRAREVPTLVVDVMNGTADLVIASRFLGGRKGIPSFRPGVDNAPSTVGKTQVVPPVTDPESTFFAISRKGIYIWTLTVKAITRGNG